MLTSFETGATFRLENLFSPELAKIIEQVSGFNKLITDSTKNVDLFAKSLGIVKDRSIEMAGAFKGIDTSLSDWGRTADKAVNSVIGSLDRVNAALATTSARIDAMSAGGSRLPHSGGFGRVGHGFGDMSETRAVFKASTSGFEAASALLPFEVTPLTAGLAVGAAGVYEAIQQQHAAAKALMGGNLDAMSFGLTRDSLVETIKSGASLTGDSFEAVAGAYTAGSRILQGVDPTTRLNLVKSLLGPAEYEAQMKGTSLEESIKSMLELAHQTGTYDPSAIQKMASQFSVASLNSNAGLDQLTNQSSYFLPQLHAAIGMDFGSGISLEVAAQNAGLLRAGTSIKNFGQNLFAKSGKGSEAHNEALRAMGLIGDDDKPLWQILGKDGQTDWTASEINIGEMIERSLSGMDDTTRMDTFHHAFGEQGGRLAALLSTKAFREQVSGIKSRVDEFGSGDLLGTLKSIDPMQQWRETWTDLKNVLGDIGTVVLPPLNVALHGLDDGFKALHATFGWFGDHFKSGTSSPPLAPNDPRSMPAIPGLGGGYGGSAASPMSYSSDDNPLTDAVYGGFLKAFRELQGTDVGGIGGGGALTNASFTTWGSGGGASRIAGIAASTPAIGKGIGHFFSAAQREANIRSYSALIGISPDYAMAVTRSEGFNVFTGDHGTSFGDFQMHIGGGLGDLYRRATGKNPWDPHNELDLDRFALDQAKKGGWGPWHGAARIGVHGFDGIGRGPVPHIAAPPVRHHEGHGGDLVVQLDGDVIYRNSMRRLSRATRFATSVGGPDTHGYPINPGTPRRDVA